MSAATGMLGSVITAVCTDPEFAERFRAEFIAPKLAMSQAIYERAQARGEIGTDVDVELIGPALAGILLHRAFLLGAPIDDASHRARHRPRDPPRRTAPLVRRAGKQHPQHQAGQPQVDEEQRKEDDMTDTTTAAVGDSTEAPAGSHKHLGWALVLICVAQLMVVLDSTIANIALPFIQHDLDVSPANLQWVVTGYALAFGGLLLLGGRLGDLYGRRRVFMIGLTLFAVACGPGRSRPERADAARLARPAGPRRRARGAGGARPDRHELPGRAAPQPARSPCTPRCPASVPRSGWCSAAGSPACTRTSSAPTSSGWRLTFLINVPIGLVAAWAAPRVLAESEAHPGELDLPGAVSGTLGLVSLVYGISRAGDRRYGWGDSGDDRLHGRRRGAAGRCSS